MGSVPDAGRPPDAGRDTGGQGPLVSGGDKVREAPAARLAEWMTHGTRDTTRLRHRALLPHHHSAARTARLQQDLASFCPAAVALNRDVRLTPMNSRGASGAVFFEAADWERRCGTGRTDRSSRPTPTARRREAMGPRWWSPIVNAEHLAMRAGEPRRLSAFAIFGVADLAPDYLQGSSSGRWTCLSGGSSTALAQPAAASWPTRR
jgi:hypothetical protein